MMAVDQMNGRLKNEEKKLGTDFKNTALKILL